MPNHILTVSRSSLSDPWPADVYEDLYSFGVNLINSANEQNGMVGFTTYISEDGLVRTLTFEFDTQENLDAWKIVQESLPLFSENLSLVQSLNADETDPYNFTDSLQGY